MTRIVAGSLGGRALATPKGVATRPTSERVREALFSRLDHLDVLAQARVLDLFAGSGALALEAISRGAAHAVLVESARPTARIARKNARELGLYGAVEVLEMPVARYCATAAPTSAFSLVFADPPYDLPETNLAALLGWLTTPGVLTSEALIVVERSIRSPEPAWPEGLTRTDERKYGETTLWFAEPATASFGT